MPSPANTHDPTAGRFFVIAGSLLGALAVMVGAFGAHALSGMLTAEQLATFEIAVRYQMYHSIALILTGVIRHMLDVPAITLGRHGLFFRYIDLLRKPLLPCPGRSALAGSRDANRWNRLCHGLAMPCGGLLESRPGSGQGSLTLLSVKNNR